jgi:hypothetical protein
MAADVFSELNTDRSSFEQSICPSVCSGYVVGGFKVKSMLFTNEQKAAWVNALAPIAKAYTQSAAFKKQYADLKTSGMPEAADKQPSMAEQLKTVKANTQSGIEMMEKMKNNAPADQKKAIDEQIDNLKKNLADMDVHPEKYTLADDQVKKLNDMMEADYKQKVEEYNASFPDDPNIMIKKRLQEFLALSATVDFNAKTHKGDNGLYYFDEEDYQHKDGQWKTIYRAGKPACDAARSFAEKWLQELH